MPKKYNSTPCPKNPPRLATGAGVMARSAKDKCSLISDWSDWFYETTETFNGALGRQLAYLWPAIAKEHQIEVTPQSAIVKHLVSHNVPDDNLIWNYIDVVSARS